MAETYLKWLVGDWYSVSLDSDLKDLLPLMYEIKNKKYTSICIVKNILYILSSLFSYLATERSGSVSHLYRAKELEYSFPNIILENNQD